MFYGRNFREQARVFIRMAEDCHDQHMAERLKAMAKSLETMAKDGEMGPPLNLVTESPRAPS
jgi:hypothetical protein